MKFRTGFVSNSSSSSFVLEIGDGIQNPQEVCFSMLKDRELFNEENSISNGKTNRVQEIVKRIKDLEIDPNIGYFFYSCNYDTYIWRIGNYIYIDTCNNTPWEIESKRIRIEEIFSDEESKYNREFYHVELNFIGKKCDSDIECKKQDGYRCYNNTWEINGKLHCASCGIKEIPKCKTPNHEVVIEKSRLSRILED